MNNLKVKHIFFEITENIKDVHTFFQFKKDGKYKEESINENVTILQ